MKKGNWLFSIGLAAALLPAAPAIAADHLDGPAVKTDHATDINDVYSWMSSDGNSVYLAMTVYPALTTGQTAQFSNAAYYVFHTMSRSSAVATPTTDVPIICGFDNGTPQQISCWLNDGSASPPFIHGDPGSLTSPLVVQGISVYAGLRKDHFFFNLDGFNAVRATARNLALSKGMAFGTAAVPTCPTNISGQAANLGKSPAGGTATDFFAQLNTLAIVLQVPTTMLNKNGPILSVWASTNRKG